MCSSKNTIRKTVLTNSYLQAGKDTLIEPLRDTQDIPASASNVEYFPQQAGQSSIRSDYQHPLPYTHVVTSVQANATVHVIRTTDLDAVDVYGIANELRQAEIQITGNRGNVVLERIALRKVMNLEDANIEHTEVGADGDGSDQFVLTLPAAGYYDLDQGIEITPGDDYGAQIVFENGSSFPAADAYEGAQLGIELDFKCVVPKPEDD